MRCILSLMRRRSLLNVSFFFDGARTEHQHDSIHHKKSHKHHATCPSSASSCLRFTRALYACKLLIRHSRKHAWMEAFQRGANAKLRNMLTWRRTHGGSRGYEAQRPRTRNRARRRQTSNTAPTITVTRPSRSASLHHDGTQQGTKRCQTLWRQPIGSARTAPPTQQPCQPDGWLLQIGDTCLPCR